MKRTNFIARMIISTLLIPLVLIMTTLACQHAGSGQQEGQSENPENAEEAGNGEHQAKVKNIILMIGDGMGLAHLYAGYTAQKGVLNITSIPYIGIKKTNSSDNYITDSAASGTAISTGKKTKNGMLGMGPDSTKLKTILELAEEYGLATGVISTSSITHATPASFVSHQVSRHMPEAIAYDFFKSDIDLFIGGGKKYFAERSDQANLIDSLEAKDFEVLTDIQKIKNFDGGKLAGLLAEEHIPRYSEGRGEMLPVSTETAIHALQDNQKGFFLMVESSQIDWGGHANDTEYIVEEVIDFDNAVEKALDFAREDGETLVIVTADHETGGFSVDKGNLEKGEITGKFTTDGHTGLWVPVYAYGPGATSFTGFYDNTDLFVKMKSAFGF